MFLALYILCLSVKVLEINMYPIPELPNLKDSEINFQEYDYANATLNDKDQKHMVSKKSTGTIKNITVLVHPDSTDEIKSLIYKKNTHLRSVKPTIKVKMVSEMNINQLMPGHTSNTSNNEIVKSVDKNYVRFVPNKIHTGTKVKLFKKPVYVLLDGDSNDSDKTTTCISTTDIKKSTNAPTEESTSTSTEPCIDLENNFSLPETSTVHCRKTSIVCLDKLDEPRSFNEERIMVFKKPEFNTTDFETLLDNGISSQSEKLSTMVEFIEMRVEDTMLYPEISTVASKHMQQLNWEKYSHMYKNTTDVAKYSKEYFKKQKIQNNTIITKDNAQTRLNISYNEINSSDNYFKNHFGSFKKNEDKLPLIKPQTNLQNRKLEQNETNGFLYEINALHNNIGKSITEQNPMIMQNEKMFLQANSNKNLTGTNYPLFVVVQDKRHQIPSTDITVCVLPSETITELTSPETTTKKKSHKITESPFSSTTEPCIELSDNVSVNPEIATAICQKTSIICLDNFVKPEKTEEEIIMIQEPENNATNFEVFAEIENVTQLEVPEPQNIYPGEVFKVTEKDSIESTTGSLPGARSMEELVQLLNIDDYKTTPEISTKFDRNFKTNVQIITGDDNNAQKHKISIHLNVNSQNNSDSDHSVVLGSGKSYSIKKTFVNDTEKNYPEISDELEP